MKSKLIVAAALAAATALAGAGASEAKYQKVDVCHFGGEGWKKINISERALRAHIGHGDAVPGDFVPTLLGDIFDSDCEPQPDHPDPVTDSDGDLLSDAEDVAHGLDEHDADTDDDGVADGSEPDWDLDSDHDAGATTTDPLNPNTDNGSGGAGDGNEDRNANGVVEYELAEHDPNDPNDDLAQPEVCGDGIDSDWNLQVDEGCG